LKEDKIRVPGGNKESKVTLSLDGKEKRIVLD
jgi:hypothetical protein